MSQSQPTITLTPTKTIFTYETPPREVVMKQPKHRLTARDIAMIQAVYEHRALSRPQLEAVFFGRPRQTISVNSRCLTRLRYLAQEGFLARFEQPQRLSDGRKPLVYFLAKRGAELLAERSACRVADLAWHPHDAKIGERCLEHLLATNDIWVAFVVGARAQGCTVTTWRDDLTLARSQMKDYVTLTSAHGAPQKVAVIPDAYCVLDTPEGRYHHFIEMDMGTVTVQASKWGKRDWARKIATYRTYYTSGKYHARYHTQSLRVLTVTSSGQRLATLKQVTEQAGGKGRFWFTTMDEVMNSDPLVDPIWEVASRSGRYTLLEQTVKE